MDLSLDVKQYHFHTDEKGIYLVHSSVEECGCDE